MKLKAILLISGVGLLGVALYRYFKTQVKILKDFTWELSALKVIKFSKTEVAMDVTFLFTSSADIEAKIERVYLDIFLQGKNVGYISEDKSFIIPAHGTSAVPLRISINPQSIFQDIINMTLGIAKSKDIQFQLKGFANIKSGFLSTTLPIDYKTTLNEYLKDLTTIKK